MCIDSIWPLFLDPVVNGAWPLLICLLKTCQWVKSLPFIYVTCCLTDNQSKLLVDVYVSRLSLTCCITHHLCFDLKHNFMSARCQWLIIATRLEAAERAKDHIWRICVQLALITAELLESRSGMKGRRNELQPCVSRSYDLRILWVLLVQIVHWTVALFKPCRWSNIVVWKVLFRGFVLLISREVHQWKVGWGKGAEILLCSKPTPRTSLKHVITSLAFRHSGRFKACGSTTAS